MSSCGVTNVKMPICISSNTSPAMDLTRLSSCQEWKVLQSDASTKHHEDSQSAEKWQSFLVFNDSHVQIVSKAQCGHFVRHLDTAFHWDLCNEPWQTEWWNRFGAWLAKRKMTLDTSYAILGCSLCSWVLWKKWKAASLGSLKGHCTTVHFSNALGARMTVPHECRYFHPLDAEANSHVAEDLHGEVAQGAVPTCARSQQMQQNKQWNILELLQYVQLCFNLLYILDIMDLWNVKRTNMDQVWSPLALSFLHWNGLHSDTCSKLATSTKSRVTFLRVAVLWNAFIAATKLDEMGPNFMQMATITWYLISHDACLVLTANLLKKIAFIIIFQCEALAK